MRIFYIQKKLIIKGEENKMNKTNKIITGLIISGVAVSSVPHNAYAWELSQWGNDLLNVKDYHEAGYTGKGVKVAVLDTGIANHNDLNIVEKVNFVSGENADDLNGHGTSVAGIIAAKDNNYGTVGIAPDVELYSVKVMDRYGTTQFSHVVKGVEWAIDNDMDIISLSLGATATQHSSVEEAFKKAEQAGILIVAGAGNHGEEVEKRGAISYPAKYNSVIAVGAIDKNESRWTKSAIGPELELVAPGVSVATTYLGNNYANANGTSHATPYVTGALALLKERYPEKTASELRQLLIENAKDLGAAGHDEEYGYGLVQLPTLPPKEEVQPNEPVDEIPTETAPIEEEQENEPTPNKEIVYDNTTNTINWSPIEGVDRYRVEIEQKDESGNYQSYSYPRSVAEASFELARFEEGFEYKLIVSPRIGWVYDKTQAFETTVTLEKEVPVEEVKEEEVTIESINIQVKGKTASLSWNGLPNAKGYRVQPLIKNDNGEFVNNSFARSTTNTSYEITNLLEGKEYKFVVIPRDGNVYDESKSGTSESISIASPEPSAPIVEEKSLAVNTEVDGTNIKVNWTQQEGISYYRVQRYVKADNGEFVEDSFPRTINGQEFLDNRTEKNKEYKYQIIPRIGSIYNTSASVISESIVSPK